MHIVTSTDILLPRAEDMGAWSVIACDQFTSEPEYWAAAEARAAEKPSTLSLMLPEAWLHTARADGADGRIADTMRRSLAEGVFQAVPDSFIYVERTLSDGRVRRGLVAALDLEQYDFTGTQRASVRSTEGTVEERLPPRVNIRRSAPLEMPHTLLLMDDRTDSVLSLAEKAKDTLEKVYDFDLMLGGGHIAGWRVSGETKAAVQSALDALDIAALQRENYGDAAENGKLTFAVGDGNHSLATAKACYEEQMKGKTPVEYLALPSRYALVEVVNNHDDALQFEPIHRVLFGVDHEKFMEEFKKFYPNAHEGKGEGHVIEVCWNGHDDYVTVPDPKVQLAVGTLQTFIDEYLKQFGGEVDYIHGDEVTRELGSKEGNMGFLLPAMGKEQLFKTVMADGVLPRKTFSMGHAQDKRYYVEARKIR